MNIYDFDGTIYRGDCTIDFWCYCLCRRPILLRRLPSLLAAALRFYRGTCSREAFKETFYGFLQDLPDPKAYAETFWKRRIHKIEPWYLRQKRADDVIISASPEFLISVACRRLGVHWIASQVDCKTGRLLSANCRGTEKVRRFLEDYPGASVDAFYSDSDSDAPLAAMATRAYRIKRGKQYPWMQDGQEENGSEDT